MEIATNRELLEDIRDKAEYLMTEEGDVEKTLYILTLITRSVTVLYRRLEEEGD